MDAVVPELLDRLQKHAAVVLEAPPGAGKTTRVPPALLDEIEGEIVVLEPRRLATRAAARRVASEIGERVGETVGYQVRFEDVRGRRLQYVTEGILARRLLGDPDLRGVGAVVLDEFHERHLPGDLALALVQRLLPRVKLIVMSATLDSGPLAKHLGVPVVRSEGRRFPVEIEYSEKPGRLANQVAAAVRKLTVPGTAGDVLVFLPGAAEIRQCTESCEEIARHRDLLLVPLHGDLPGDEQDRALSPADRRKIILSTNVAETSVTVPGVTAVIDSGLARIATHSPWSGLPNLSVAKISRASAEQRAGRAGRTQPGRALRLYSRHDFEARPDHHPPEIERLDLAGMLLDLRAAGLDPWKLPWLDPPPSGALHSAGELLRRLGIVGPEMEKLCARFPVHPRLSRLIVEAARRGYREAGCTIAASLNERTTSSVFDALELLDQRADVRATRQLLRFAPPDGERTETRDQALRLALLTAFPDRVAKRRGDEVLLASGGAAQVPSQAPPLLVAIDAEERGRGRIVVRLASAIEPEWLLDSPELHEETELIWEQSRHRVEAITRLRYEQLTLEETRRLPGPEEAIEAARILLEHAEPPDTAELKARSALVAKYCPEAGIEPLTDDAIARAMREAAKGLTSLKELREAHVPLVRDRAALDRLAPEFVALPSGRKLKVEYAEGQPPAVRSRLQDFLGLAKGPAICNGRLPLTLHLLAPNGRAQQVTQDLAGFWERHYPAVRRELMRKYPRHPWPENGATATTPSVNRRPHR
ncbi:MAG: ATP-dependent helicase HrpB [Deltaproteobacteria bacterium]|nr:MAG: ATP-dependent helicase HrpB [Deltaproteobacteria bacterium]